MIKIVVILDPQTNQVGLESPLPLADTLVVLERAKLAMVQQANKPKAPLDLPTAEQTRRLTNGHHHG